MWTNPETGTNLRLTAGDFALLCLFILQGMWSHDSSASFGEILLPFAAVAALLLPALHYGGRDTSSLPAWLAVIVAGAALRFTLNGSVAPAFLAVITGYTFATSGLLRLASERWGNRPTSGR